MDLAQKNTFQPDSLSLDQTRSRKNLTLAIAGGDEGQDSSTMAEVGSSGPEPDFAQMA